MSEQLLLPAPYGYGNGYHVSLRAAEGFDESVVKKEIEACGCPPRIARKAISCLQASGRYDCVLSSDGYNAVIRGYTHGRLLDAGVNIRLRAEPRKRRFFSTQNLPRILR